MSVMKDLKLHLMISNHFIWNWKLQFMTPHCNDQIRNTAFPIGEIFCCLGARPLQIQPRHHPPNSSEEGEWINWDCFFLLASFFSRRVWQPDLRSAVVGQFLSLSTTSRLEILCCSILLFLMSYYLLSLIINICKTFARLEGPRGRAEQGKTAQEVEHLRLWRSFQVFLKIFSDSKVLIGFDGRKPGRHESTELSCRNSYDRSFIAQWLCQRCHNMEDFKIAIAYYNKELLFPNKE